MKNLQFHMDVQPGQRMFFYTTTGWMMWNFLVSAPLSGVIPVLYDGSPTWPASDALWRMAEETGISFFGASPTYQQLLAREGVVPRERFDLSRLESVTLAGSPVTPECMLWFHENVKRDKWVQSGSGGTDVCSGFCGAWSSSLLAGESGASAWPLSAAFDTEGNSVVDEVGEMVIHRPRPQCPSVSGTIPATCVTASRISISGRLAPGDFFRINARRLLRTGPFGST